MPAKTDAKGGQTGYNDCQQRYGASNPKAKCQNVFINSVKDFCLWGPPNLTTSDTVGDLEAVMVSYCMKSGYGTRLIPDGTIKGAHFLKTPSFVQITGTGDFTKIHIRAGDEGGELDPHGATGSGNPVGGVVFTRAYTGNWEQLPDGRTSCRPPSTASVLAVTVLGTSSGAPHLRCHGLHVERACQLRPQRL